MLAFLTPFIIVVFAAYSALWGSEIGLEHTVFILLASLLLIDVLLAGYQKIPFACSHAAGKRNIGLVLALYALSFFVFSIGLAHLEHWTLSSRSAVPFLVLSIFLIFLLVIVRVYARELAIERPSVIFSDEAEPVVRSMDLR